ncbi:hypothetical protein GTQ40_08235 [Flavobacteriaceae bacterium R38]|nr:hypothetical protein [Flavobacteriaceae bacterium R38]
MKYSTNFSSKTKRPSFETQLESLLNNFIDVKIPLPRIIEPNGGFQVYVFIEESNDGSFIYNQESIYFWPGIFRFYSGLKPLKKVVLSNVSSIAPGITPLYKGEVIRTNEAFIFDEKLLVIEGDSHGLEIPKIDHFFNIEVDPLKYKGAENLFSMILQTEDFLGNVSNKVTLNFVCCNTIV